jgi:hypothetical protein
MGAAARRERLDLPVAPERLGLQVPPAQRGRLDQPERPGLRARSHLSWSYAQLTLLHQTTGKEVDEGTGHTREVSVNRACRTHYSWVVQRQADTA